MCRVNNECLKFVHADIPQKSWLGHICNEIDKHMCVSVSIQVSMYQEQVVVKGLNLWAKGHPNVWIVDTQNQDSATPFPFQQNTFFHEYVCVTHNNNNINFSFHHLTS